MLLISYATPEYFDAQRALTKEAYLCGFEEVKPYRAEDIDQFFYQENEYILSHPRGAGSALWKPYFIEKNLLQPVIYMDCGDKIKDQSFKNYIGTKVITRGYFIVRGTHPNYKNTRSDCFNIMGCKESKYTGANQLEAGICGFTSNFHWFVQEWLDWCRVSEVVMDTKNKNLFGDRNDNNFITHRCDQSVLTNLAIKHGLYDYATPIQEVMNYVDYNARG